MTTTATRSALAEPLEPVGRAWVVWLSLASIAVWAGFFGPIQVLLAQQAESVDAAHKETVLALVTGLGAAVSTVLNPVTLAGELVGAAILWWDYRKARSTSRAAS